MTELKFDVCVVGAGVLGLAVARRLAPGGSVVLLESHSKFGQETSSRNSEVIHSGIYYPADSRKTAWCLEGKRRLYEYCEAFGVPYARTGKIVVAQSEAQTASLEKLSGHCQNLNVACEFLTGTEVAVREPLVKVHSGIFLPETGIVDSHVFMARLEEQARQMGVLIAYRHRVKQIEKSRSGFRIEVEAPDGEFVLFAEIVVNAAGLAAAEITNAALQTERYAHRYCRGRYFNLSGSYQNKFQHLIYPVPPKDGLGIHVTVDLNGQARIGPDVDWCDESEYACRLKQYDCDWGSLAPSFVGAVKRYAPSIEVAHVRAGQIGIRPKLFIDGKAHPDFLVEKVGGFIHALGIESPGLTAALAIAEEVVRLTDS